MTVPVSGALADLLAAEVGKERSTEVVLAIESVWAILGYSGKPNKQTLFALASVIAGLLEAEKIHAGARSSAWKDQRDRVRLRLVEVARSVVGSGHGEEAEEDKHARR